MTDPVEYESKVSLALKGTVSVRTTVPEPIARLIGAGPGSVLRWAVIPGSREAKVSVVVEQPKKRSKGA